MGLGTDGEERLILQKLEDLWPKALPRRTVKGGGKVERRELVFPLLGRVKRFLVSDLLRTYPIGIESFFSKALSWHQDILRYWIGLITETLLLNRSDLKEFRKKKNPDDHLQMAGPSGCSFAKEKRENCCGRKDIWWPCQCLDEKLIQVRENGFQNKINSPSGAPGSARPERVNILKKIQNVKPTLVNVILGKSKSYCLSLA